MDIDEDDNSQRPLEDPAALERELDDKYESNPSRAITYLTSPADTPIDLTIVLRRSHSMLSFKTSSIPSTRTRRSLQARLPTARGWVLMAHGALIHMRSVGLSLSVSSLNGEVRLGTTYSLPFA